MNFYDRGIVFARMESISGEAYVNIADISLVDIATDPNFSVIHLRNGQNVHVKGTPEEILKLVAETV